MVNKSIVKLGVVISHEEIMNMFFTNLNSPYQHVVWNKMYRSDIFKEIRFEIGNMVEDFRIIPYILKECDSGIVIEIKAVCYRLRPDSVSHLVNAKLYADRVFSWARVYEIAKQEKTPEINTAIDCFERNFYSCYYAVWRSSEMKSNNPNNEKERKKSLKRMRKDFRFVFPSLIKSSYQKSTKKLICAIAFFVSPYLFLMYNKLFKVF